MYNASSNTTPHEFDAMPQFRPDSLIASVLIAGLVLFLALQFG